MNMNKKAKHLIARLWEYADHMEKESIYLKDAITKIKKELKK